MFETVIRITQSSENVNKELINKELQNLTKDLTDLINLHNKKVEILHTLNLKSKNTIDFDVDFHSFENKKLLLNDVRFKGFSNSPERHMLENILNNTFGYFKINQLIADMLSEFYLSNCITIISNMFNEIEELNEESILEQFLAEVGVLV